MAGKDVRKKGRTVNKEIAEIVDKYITVVKENYDVVAIILFGSYAICSRSKKYRNRSSII